MTRRESTSALSYVLPATVLASVLGLAVQVLVPLVRPAADYVDFTLFWSTLFFAVAAVSGVQQELSRAARPGPGSDQSRRTLTRYTGGVAVIVLVATAVLAIIVIALGQPAQPLSFAIGIVAGVSAYVALAAAVGTLFGAERWRGAAVGMFADPAVRAVLFAAVAVSVLAFALTPTPAVLYAAAAVPFLIAAAMMWLTARRGTGFTLSDAAPTLWRNTAHTVVAAASLGLVSIGLPLLVRVAAPAESATMLAGALLVVTLGRAPLVSPALALQSYLTVSLRTGATRRRVVRLSVLLIALGAALAALAAWLVPPLIRTLVPSYGVPSTAFIAVVVGSAALVAVQCVTGAALLARGQHRWYTVGWLTTALAALALAAVPAPFEARIGIMLCAAPAIGLAVHIAAIVRSGQREPHQA